MSILNRDWFRDGVVYKTRREIGDEIVTTELLVITEAVYDEEGNELAPAIEEWVETQRRPRSADEDAALADKADKDATEARWLVAAAKALDELDANAKAIRARVPVYQGDPFTSQNAVNLLNSELVPDIAKLADMVADVTEIAEALLAIEMRRRRA